MLRIVRKLFKELLLLTILFIIVCILLLSLFTSKNISNKVDENQSKVVATTANSTKIVTLDTLLESAITCEQIHNFHPQNEFRNDHYVIYNYVKARKKFQCFNAVTYTTHADYSFLDNLPVLVELWQNPISIALYASGSDFDKTVDSIRYLKDCVPYVADYVTFHLYFHAKHVPKNYKSQTLLLNKTCDCKRIAPYSNVSQNDMYKTKNKLLYPINIGRNVARLSATTHYILPSDIELYPSQHLPNKFLAMISQEPALFKEKNTVFPLAIFEVDESQKVPKNKTVLQLMLKNKTAIKFHQKVCAGCHTVPKAENWVQLAETNDNRFHVFTTSKRKGSFYRWEPIFIGTNNEPLYDERLSWEGRNDKMTQAYIMCLLNYNFKVLDSGFLVHKPGIKTVKSAHIDKKIVGATNKRILSEIIPQIDKLYKKIPGCKF